MRKISFILLLLTVCFNASAGKGTEQSKIVLAYVTSGGHQLPDPSHVTHINYAFANVNETFDGMVIENESRLIEITALKKKNPKLKVLLSIGGWGSGRFSEMAANDKTRMAFAKDCKRVINEFYLDGVDLDWEYPTQSGAGISSSPDDTHNFTLLMRDIRSVIGKKKMLTLASAANGKYVDFVAIDPYIDLVNIMTYDIARPPYHHSALYSSSNTVSLSCDDAVKAHIKAGVPLNKLVLGIPFYGHGDKSILPDFIDYKDIIKLDGYTKRWDDKAKLPYLTDESGKLVVCYDDPQSIAIKCEYVKTKALRGVMYWHYGADDEDLSLVKASYNGMFK